MTYFTDGKKTIGIELSSSRNALDWSADFFEVGRLEINENHYAYDSIDQPVYKVEDVDVLILAAHNWKDAVGDYYSDRENESPEKIADRYIDITLCQLYRYNDFIAKDEWEGREIRVQLTLHKYDSYDNAVYIGLDYYYQDDFETDDEPYFRDLTVNLGDDMKSLEPYEAYINVGEYPEARQFIEENGLGEFTGKTLKKAGIEYPLFKFNREELLNTIPAQVMKYEKSLLKDDPKVTEDKKYASNVYECKMTCTYTVYIRAENEARVYDWLQTHSFDDIKRETSSYDVDWHEEITDNVGPLYAAAIDLTSSESKETRYSIMESCCKVPSSEKTRIKEGVTQEVWRGRGLHDIVNLPVRDFTSLDDAKEYLKNLHTMITWDPYLKFYLVEEFFIQEEKYNKDIEEWELIDIHDFSQIPKESKDKDMKEYLNELTL